MLPFVSVLGRTFPMYGIMAATAFVAGLLFVMGRAKRFGNGVNDSIFLYLWIAIGGAVGAKLLYLLTVLPNMIRDIPLVINDFPRFWNLYLTGGFVFYGGVVGGLLGAVMAARYFSLTLVDYIPQMAPAIPLAHAIGRIGCFCAGCCYGIPMRGGIVFHHSIAAPNGVALFPVQLVESAAEFVIFVILVIATNRGTNFQKATTVKTDSIASNRMKGWDYLALYVGLYAPVRFVDEFFRGDVIRGIFGGLSTSQWISLLAMFGVAVYFVLRRQGVLTGRARLARL